MNEKITPVKPLNLVLHLIRIITGAVFIFAGFVKLVDPWGAQIKLQDYFEAFHMEFLLPIALIVGVGMAVLEFMVGWMLLLRLCSRVTSWVLLGFMTFFTVLTFVLALTNPVTDCGCFGDAIKLTNWQTFYKNIVLFGFATVLFVSKKNWNTSKSRAIQGYTILVVFILASYIPHYSYHHLPIIDFRAYAKGNDLLEMTKLPADAKQDVYSDLFYYEKNGEVKEFTAETYPWQDSTWTFVEVKSVLVEKGDAPAISDFYVLDENQNDVTQDVLHNPDAQFYLVSYDLASIKPARLKVIKALLAELNKEGVVLNVLTASSSEVVEQFKYIMPNPVNIYYLDKTVAKTMVRANPGLLVLKEGVIIDKMNLTKLPYVDYLKSPLSETLKQERKADSKLIILYLLFVFGIALAVPGMINKIVKIK